MTVDEIREFYEAGILTHQEAVDKLKQELNFTNFEANYAVDAWK